MDGVNQATCEPQPMVNRSLTVGEVLELAIKRQQERAHELAIVRAMLPTVMTPEQENALRNILFNPIQF